MSIELRVCQVPEKAITNYKSHANFLSNRYRDIAQFSGVMVTFLVIFWTFIVLGILGAIFNASSQSFKDYVERMQSGWLKGLMQVVLIIATIAFSIATFIFAIIGISSLNDKNNDSF